MFGRDAREVHRLRACPMCGSAAVSGMSDRELGESRVLLRVRCGACGALRATRLHWWHAQTVEARLRRRHRRDRRQMARDLRRLQTARFEPRDLSADQGERYTRMHRRTPWSPDTRRRSLGA